MRLTPFLAATALVAGLAAATPSQASALADGTLKIKANFNPEVDFNVDEQIRPGAETINAFGARNGAVSITGTGNYASFTSGVMDGFVHFYDLATRNGELSERDQNFLVIDTLFKTAFNVEEVKTLTYDVGGRADHVALHLTGTMTSELSDPTAAWMDLDFMQSGTDDNGGPLWTTTASLTIGTPAAAVPEPVSWALMLGGFGLVGGALRSRRRTTAITFA